MDTKTSRGWIRKTAIGLSLAVAGITGSVLGAQPAASTSAPGTMTITGADAEDTMAIEWAHKRFALGGLEELPALEIHVHTAAEPCRGGLGYHLRGRIDLCTKDSSEAYAKKFALHEMTHAWVERYLDRRLLDRFMDERGVASWNDQKAPWKERGIEQAAEVLTWGLGEGEVAPLLPQPLEASELARLYELLTGRAPIIAGA